MSVASSSLALGKSSSSRALRREASWLGSNEAAYIHEAAAVRVSAWESQFDEWVMMLLVLG